MPTNPRANNIGTMRLAGALAVLVGHSFVLSHGGGPADPVSQALHDVTPQRFGLPGVGVAMFFAISGYLVSRSAVRRGNLLAYLEARLLRIYPALWLAVALTLLAGAVVSTYPPWDFAASERTIAYALHDASLIDLRFKLPGVFTANPIDSVNGSLWTLPVEMLMYVAVAIAGVLGLLGRRLAFNLALGALVLVAAAWPGSLPLLSEGSHVEIAAFFAAGAALYVNRELIPLRFAGLAGLAALTAALSWTGAYSMLFAFTFSYGVLWLGFTPAVRLPDLAARGDLSYGTYLYAFPLAQLWIAAIGPGAPLAIAGLTLASCLPLALASWRLVEAPALRLKGRLVPAKLTERSVIVRATE
jgi:peptidoglycan/LPS O-acetylase OafA/YrhL